MFVGMGVMVGGRGDIVGVIVIVDVAVGVIGVVGFEVGVIAVMGVVVGPIVAIGVASTWLHDVVVMSTTKVMISSLILACFI